MTLDRRRFIAGTSALLASPYILSAPVYAASGSRTWLATRGRQKFGSQTVAVQRSGSTAIVDFKTRLKGILLVIPVTYRLDCREIWEGGVLQSISATAKQNSEEFFVEAKRVGDEMEVKSTKYNGRVKGNIGTTTFFVSDIVERDVWISTQSGKPMRVNVTRKADRPVKIAGSQITCAHYRCGGQIKYPIDAYFDGNGELAAYRFDALGKTNHFVAKSLDPQLRPLWA